MGFKFRHICTSTLRETLADGVLPDLEFGLLKTHGSKLGWDPEDKAVVLEMAIETLEARLAHMVFEVRIRSLCHSRGVTADYLSFKERFNMMHCLLVLGDMGEVPCAWAQLLQPAVYFYAHDFNVLFVEVPAFETNSSKWMQHGAALLRAVLKHMCMESVSVLSCGVGGSICLKALTESKKLFGRSHHIFNLDFPHGTKSLPIDFRELEEMLINSGLSDEPLQLWLAHQDVKGVYDRQTAGTPWKASDAISKLQARISGLRQGRHVKYDEVLISDKMNNATAQHVQRVLIGRTVLLVFSHDYLENLCNFFRLTPYALNDDIADGGLISNRRQINDAKVRMAIGDDIELPALRKLRIGPSKKERAEIAEKNRKLFLGFQGNALQMLKPSVSMPMLPPVFSPAALPDLPDEAGNEAVQGDMVKSASSVALVSRQMQKPKTVEDIEQVRDLIVHRNHEEEVEYEDEDEEGEQMEGEESFFAMDSEAYRNEWDGLRKDWSWRGRKRGVPQRSRKLTVRPEF